MKFLGNAILVSQKTSINQTLNGLYIPDKYVIPRNRGTITHIGTNVAKELLGKEVLFQLPAAKDFEYDKTKGKLIYVTDIIATLN